MDSIIKQRLKLEHKKARIITAEGKLKIQERKARTRRLIEIGGLVVKAKLDNLPNNALFGALISLSNELTQSPNVQTQWIKTGKDIFDQKL
ncbi:conjugal transfer protein TraD [Rickettsia massiliae]|nr:conjugal transfer protein TraD [Rickettsia massiliae]